MLPIPKLTIQSRQLIACIVPSLIFAIMLQAFTEGTEFSVGSLTRYVLRFHIGATNLLLVSLMCAAWFPRVAACLCICGAILCLPMYGYFLVPGIYRWAFPGDYSVSTLNFFELDPFSLIGMCTAVFAIYRAVRILVDQYNVV